MSTTFGSTDTLADCSLDERLAARLLSAWVPLVDAQFDRGGIRFDRDRLRIALHGESEHPGDGYTRGMVVMALWAMNAMFAMLPVGVLAAVPVSDSASVVLLAALVSAMVVTATVGTVLAMGSVGALNKTELVDHTVPEQPREELAAAREAFVDGDLDEAEFGARVEEVLER